MDRGTIWKITAAGLKKLKLIQENKMDYLRKKGILHCVHILEISKSGTVKELV